MTVLIVALIAALFVLGGVFGAFSYGLVRLAGLTWRRLAHATRSADDTRVRHRSAQRKAVSPVPR